MAYLQDIAIIKFKRAPASLTVVEHKPWRRPLVMLFTIAIGVGCLMLGFVLGHRQVVTDRIVRNELQQQVETTQSRLAEVDAELVDVRLNAQMNAAAVEALRQDLTRAHQKSAQLQEEVTFYKGLMAPSSLSSGLQVAELELARGEQDAQYTWQLLLTQVALRRSYIAGELRIDVIGAYMDTVHDGDGEAVLSLTELSETKAYPLKFRFRYFQDLAGRITLPPGFSPERVLVTANQNGKDPLQVTFPWPVS